MNSKTRNPFNVTKAVDFSDQQILDFWVDWPRADRSEPDSSGILNLVQPTSPMPMIIEGGKGSGKTHLMRYLTLTNQLLRSDNNVEQTLDEDGYIGIYVRFSALNASRFKGKNQSAEIWASIFAYYSELWLGQIMLESIARLAELSPAVAADIATVGQDLARMLTKAPASDLSTLQDFLTYLQQEQRLVDHEINNCGLTGTLDIAINMNRGALIFDGCQVISQSSELLRDIMFLFLLDEYENLNAEQQVYVNTLIREKRPPANFKIGTRSYGMKTYKTLNSGERLKEGSEFSLLKLDDQLRSDPKAYNDFCLEIISRRLDKTSDGVRDGDQELIKPDKLNKALVSQSTNYYLQPETKLIISKYAGRERPYFRKLKQEILKYAAKEQKAEQSEKIADEIIQNLVATEFPLLEKVHIFLFYRAWAKNQPLLEASHDIRALYKAFTENRSDDACYKKILNKFKEDLFAQLLRQCDRKQLYTGLDNFIRMSAGLPRNLLVLLKHVYAWAEFKGEKPFRGESISIEAQQQGVLDAADWFREDARIPGEVGQQVLEGVDRLAELFRGVRLADKPAECSLVTFSVNFNSLDEGTQKAIDTCEKWSLLIRIPQGQKDKNSKQIHAKYQLSPMLAPLWQLPVSRRGAIALNRTEIESIFASRERDKFDEVLKLRLKPMNVPFTNGVKIREQGEFDFDSN